MPADLLREQSLRLAVIYVIGALLWALNLVMDHFWAPQGDRGPYRALIEVVSIALAAATACFVRFGGNPSNKGRCRRRVDDSTRACARLAQQLAPQPTTVRPLSSITVLILIFGMLTPSRPVTMLVASSVAASMDPLAVWIAHLRGLPVPSPINTLLFFYPNYVCAVLAVVPARLVRRFGRQILEARALGSYELIRRLGEGGIRHVFMMTGAVPNTRWLDGCIALEDKGFVKTGPDLSSDELAAARWPHTRPSYLLETNRPGIFAVGDVRGGNVKRVASAVGERSIAVALVHQVLRP
jgi:hypothetical protein